MILISQVVLAIGVNLESMTIMLISRLVYGAAGDSMVALSIAMFAEYFLPQELGLAVGIYFLLSHLGVLLCLLISPYLGEEVGIKFAYYIAVFWSLLGLFFRLFLAKVDRHYLKLKKEHEVANKIKKETGPELDFSRGCRGFWRVFFQKFQKGFWIASLFGSSMFNGVYIMINLGKTYLAKTYYSELSQAEKDKTVDNEYFLFQLVIICGNLLFGFIAYKWKSYTWAYLPGPLIFAASIALLMLSWSPIIAFTFAGISVSIFYSNFWSNLMITLQEKDRVAAKRGTPLLFGCLNGEIGVCFWDNGLS